MERIGTSPHIVSRASSDAFMILPFSYNSIVCWWLCWCWTEEREHLRHEVYMLCIFRVPPQTVMRAFSRRQLAGFDTLTLSVLHGRHNDSFSARLVISIDTTAASVGRNFPCLLELILHWVTGSLSHVQWVHTFYVAAWYFLLLKMEKD